MGRNTKYSTVQLIDAITRYDIAFPDKIKLTFSEISEWSRSTIDDLATVQAYHFSRNVNCKQKLSEINDQKKVHALGNSTLLTTPSGIEDFFILSEVEQRRVLLKSKHLIYELQTAITDLQYQNRLMQEENEALLAYKKTQEGTSEKFIALDKKLNKVAKQLSYVLKNIEQEKLAQFLAEIGITDTKKSALRYIDFKKTVAEEVLDFDSILKNYEHSNADISIEGLLQDLLH